MKHGRLLLLVSICVVPLACAGSRDGRESGSRRAGLVVISYNIRVNVESDGQNAWPYRADDVAALLQFHGADIAGLQEATAPQVADVAERLQGYDWYGVGRDDGGQAGEFVPIFYRQSLFKALERGTFWLSATPDVPGSVGWDAALPRVTSWILLEGDDGDRLYVFNTHFDHRGETARVESARLLWDTVRERSGGTPTIVMGDFNTRPDTEPYRIMTRSVERGPHLLDSATLATPYGPDFTFSTFEVGREEPGRIDFVFVTPGVQVLRTGALTDQRRGRYPSDHLPVLAEIAIRK